MKHPPETEAGFQATVTDLATLRGWMLYHTHDSRRSAAGFPDLVLVRAGQIVFAELKREKSKTTKDQDEWLMALDAVAVEAQSQSDLVNQEWGWKRDEDGLPRYAPVVQSFVWRPSDWKTIEKVLR